MKILIAYYSRGGSTKELALAIKDELATRGHSIDIEDVKPKQEHGFWYWFIVRIFKGECDIFEPKIKNVSGYDAVLIGSPNWTRLSLPMARYLNTISGLEFKNVYLFSTTALWPWFEWYVFSAYLFDITFRRIINKKRGRFALDIMLSSMFKKNWGIVSSYGKKKIMELCNGIENPIVSYKNFVLSQNEIENGRFLIVSFLVFSILFGVVPLFLGIKNHFSGQALIFFSSFLLSSIVLIYLIIKRAIKFLKYIASFSMVIGWFLANFLFSASTHWGISIPFLLIISFMGLLKNIRLIIFTSLGFFVGYAVFWVSFPSQILSPISDISLILLITAFVSFFTKSAGKNYLDLLENQDELENKTLKLNVTNRDLLTATDALQKEKAELEGLKNNLENIVKERTKELQAKLEELERFHDLTVGREMKMIELKKEIAALKSEPRSTDIEREKLKGK